MPYHLQNNYALLIIRSFVIGILKTQIITVGFGAFPNQSFARNQSLVLPMHLAAQSLANIQSFVLDPTKITSIEPIIRETENIGRFIHSVKKNAAYEVDPSFHFILRRMDTEIKEAVKSLKGSDLKAARHILSRVTGFCISCHTRTAKGRQFDFSKTSPKFGKDDHLLKANYMAATRQFDKAIEYYEYFLADKNLATKQQRTWQLAIRRLLAITVRVKQNPSLTMEMISALLDRKAIPKELLEELRTWRSAAKTWREESLANKKTEPPLLQAQKLISKAQRYRKTTFGLVEFLRASNILHRFLDHEKSRVKIGEALYWSGVTAGALDDINFWTMDDYYYEACIRLKSNSYAKKCFEGYRAAQLKNFGQLKNIPNHIKARLETLKQLSGYQKP